MGLHSKNDYSITFVASIGDRIYNVKIESYDAKVKFLKHDFEVLEGIRIKTNIPHENLIENGFIAVHDFTESGRLYTNDPGMLVNCSVLVTSYTIGNKWIDAFPPPEEDKMIVKTGDVLVFIRDAVFRM